MAGIALFSIAFRRGTAGTAAAEIEIIRGLMSYFCLFMVSIPLFLTLYTDDFKSGTMVGVIGRGISRRKVLLAKMVEAGCIYLMFFVLAFGAAFLRNATSGVAVTTRQNLFLALHALYCVVKGTGFFAIATLVVFATWSPAGGMTVLILAATLSGLLFQAIQEEFLVPVYDFSFDGLLEASFASISAGEPGWQIVPAVLFYICAVTGLAVRLFERREMDL